MTPSAETHQMNVKLGCSLYPAPNVHFGGNMCFTPGFCSAFGEVCWDSFEYWLECAMRFKVVIVSDGQKNMVSFPVPFEHMHILLWHWWLLRSFSDALSLHVSLSNVWYMPFQWVRAVCLELPIFFVCKDTVIMLLCTYYCILEPSLANVKILYLWLQKILSHCTKLVPIFYTHTGVIFMLLPLY